jgi:hypothetical protein
MVMEMETIVSIIFWLVTLWVVIRFNKDLHKDIFSSNEIPKRQWKFVNEIDGKEYTIEEM